MIPGLFMAAGHVVAVALYEVNSIELAGWASCDISTQTACQKDD